MKIEHDSFRPAMEYVSKEEIRMVGFATRTQVVARNVHCAKLGKVTLLPTVSVIQTFQAF